MEEEVWPQVLARTRQSDQLAVEQVLVWLHQGQGKQILSTHLRRRGVPAQYLEDAVAAVEETMWGVLMAGRFRGNSRGEFILYVSRVCRTVAGDYRKPAGEILLSALSRPDGSPTEWGTLGSDLETPFVFLDGTTTDPAKIASLCRDLEAALAWLPDRYAQAWILRDVQGYDVEEIAPLMHCRLTQATKLVTKARRELRRWMTFLALVVDIALIPSLPAEGQEVVSWLDLWNPGYADIPKLKLTLKVDKRRLGCHTTSIHCHNRIKVQKFSPWIRRLEHQTLFATWAYGKKKASKTLTLDALPSKGRAGSLAPPPARERVPINPTRQRLKSSKRRATRWMEDVVEAWRRQHRGCPDAAALVAYSQGTDRWPQRLTLGWHVRRCALCRADLITLQEASATRPSDTNR